MGRGPSMLYLLFFVAINRFTCILRSWTTYRWWYLVLAVCCHSWRAVKYGLDERNVVVRQGPQSLTS